MELEIIHVARLPKARGPLVIARLERQPGGARDRIVAFEPVAGHGDGVRRLVPGHGVAVHVAVGARDFHIIGSLCKPREIDALAVGRRRAGRAHLVAVCVVERQVKVTVRVGEIDLEEVVGSAFFCQLDGVIINVRGRMDCGGCAAVGIGPDF